MNFDRTFFIAGVQFRPEKDALLDCKVGDYMALLPEPENKFDPNAVQILTEDSAHVGYVPKKYSAEIAGLLSGGIPLRCQVTKLDKNAKLWELCEVKITVPDLLEEPEGGEIEDNEYDGLCPNCDSEIEDDSGVCPNCGEYLE